MDTVVGTLESPGTRSSHVAVGTGDDGVGGDELSLVVVVSPSGSGADATRTADVDAALDVIEHLLDFLIGVNIARGSTVQDSVASISSELKGAIKVDGVGGRGISDVDFEANDVGTDDKIAVLDNNGRTDVHQLVELDGASCGVGDGALGHVVGVDLLAVDVDDDTVGGLDGEGEGGVGVEVIDVEGLSEVGGGSSEVAEGAGLGLLPAAGRGALNLGPVSRSRGAAVQELVGLVDGSDEVTDVEGEVLGVLVVTKRAEEDDALISKEDSEVTGIPAVVAAIGEGESVDARGSALRVVVGLVVGELVLIDEDASVAVLQLEAHFGTSGTSLDEDRELVVGIETVLNGERDLSGDGLALGSLGGDGVGGTRHEGVRSTTNGASGGIELERELEGRGDCVVGEEVGGRSDLRERNANVTGVGVGVEAEGRNNQLVEIHHGEGELGNGQAVRNGGGDGSLGDDHSVLAVGLPVVGEEEASGGGSGGEVGVGDVAEELEG